MECTPAFAEIIIADNASTDDSISFIQNNYPNIRLVQLPQNFGFAEGYNQALRQLDGYKYWILLNSDIEVTPGWVPPLIRLMEENAGIAVCQPKILAYTQKQYFEYAGGAGGWMDNLGYPFCRGRIFHITEKDQGQYDDIAPLFWASGAAFCVRSRLFFEAGGFDKDYFAHLEEIDLCWRLKRAGYKIMAQPEAVIYHMGGGTLNYNTPRKSFLNFRNSLFTLVKNEPAGRLAWLIPTRFLLDALAALLFLSKGNLAHIGSIIRAHWNFWYYFPRFIKKRKETSVRVERVRHSQPNTEGRYSGSIVWGFYAQRKRTFAAYKTAR